MYFKSTNVFSRFELILKNNEILYTKEKINKYLVYHEEETQKEILKALINGFVIGASIEVKMLDINSKCFMVILNKRS